jgi:hypothetical protein
MKKKHHDLIKLSGSAPPNGGLHPDLLPLWTEGTLPQGMPKRGTAKETAPSAKVTTGGLSAPVSR